MPVSVPPTSGLRLSLRPTSIPPSTQELQSLAADLRAEAELAQSPEERAVLLYEIGVLEELHKDDHGAAKDLLAAVNTATALSEPLEQLIALIERRHSFQNLGKLLDRLGRVAASPEEIVRAQLARGDYLFDHRHEPDAARAAYALAEQAGIELPSVWLSLELVAGKQKDLELQRRVVTARAAATGDPNYRALLRLRAARAALLSSDERGAMRLFEQLAGEPSAARDAALLELERHALAEGDKRRVAELREVRAQWLSQLAEQPSKAHNISLTSAAALQIQAAELWVRAARVFRELGDHDRALANLARAERHLPKNQMVLLGLLDAHLAMGNAQGAQQAVQSLLEQNPERGPGQAALLYRCAQLEHHLGQDSAALTSLQRALELDPCCLPARALQVHLLLGRDDPGALADAFESIASESRREDTRARYYALAALCWAQSSGNSEAARAALSQATLAGLGQRPAARLGRVLATLSQDARWQNEARERLLRCSPLEEEASLLLQQVQSNWLRGQTTRTEEALQRLGQHPTGAWLSELMFAYPTLDRRVTERSTLALRKLSEQAEPELRAAFSQLIALRYRRAGDPVKAREVLAELHETSPKDLGVACALGVALMQSGQALEAAAVLADSASLNSDADVSLALLLQAGMWAWHGGHPEQSVEYFETASRVSSAANGLLHWALCSARPDDVEARERALQVALETTQDADVYALESFALHVGDPQALARATRSLDRADDVSLGESGEAVQLARALWPHSSLHAAALRHIEGQSARGHEVVHAVRYLQLRAAPHAANAELHKQARTWAATGSLVGTLEWLGTSVTSLDVNEELSARRALCEALPSEPRAAIAAGSALIEALTQNTPPALLEDTGQAAALVNLELSQPGCDPRRRSAALNASAGTLDDENAALDVALAGYNELAAQNADAALNSFRAVVKSFPEDVFAWEGLRLAAAALEERSLEAQACLKLGSLARDSKAQARHLRAAARLFLDELHDEQQGQAALARAVALDIRHRASFNRYHGLLKAQREAVAICELLQRRIAVSNDATELVNLYWELARTYRERGDFERALEELTNLNLLDANHVGSRALRGEIYLRQGQHEAAAAELCELARLESAPAEQRLMGGIAAVDLFDSELHDLSKALEVLRGLQSSNLDTLAVQERLAKATARAGRWQDAAELLEQLMRQRQTGAGRAEAARLLLAIYRDQLEQPDRARAACEVVLRHAPTDPEAIDFVLEDVLDEAATNTLLVQIKGALLEAPAADLSPEQLARIARVAEALEDLPLRQVALGALVCIGVTSSEILEELEQLDQLCPAQPKVVLQGLDQSGLLNPSESGPLSQAFALVGPFSSDAFGPDLASLQITRRNRVRGPHAATLRSELAAFAGALGVGDFDLYVGGPEPLGINVIAHPTTPSFVVGASVQLPLSPAQRVQVMERVLALVRGTSALLDRDVVDCAALAAAVVKLGGATAPGPVYAKTAEFERTLSKHVPRRVKKQLEQLVAQRGALDQDPLNWARAVHQSFDRAAALAVADASWVFLTAEQRRTSERHWDDATEARLWQLLRFTLSPTFLGLRAQLGMNAQ